MDVAHWKLVVAGDEDLRETLMAKDEEGPHPHLVVDHSKPRYA